jgi:hypothetical protein
MDTIDPVRPADTTARQGSRRWVYLILLVWMLVVAALLWYSMQLPRNWFDPSQTLPHPLHDDASLNRLKAALNGIQPDLSFTRPVFVRFMQASCKCEQLVDAYHQLQMPLLAQQGYQTLTLDDRHMQQLAHTGLPELYSWITATPAILVLDGNGNLAYFGPYHQDGICSSESSYLEPVLRAVNSGQPVNIINTLVFGCFCPTAD